MKKLAKFWALGHIKPAIILPLIALICVLGGAIFWHVGPKTQAAAAGQIQIAPTEVWKLHNPLMPALVRIPEIPHDPNDAALLQQTFAEANAAAISVRQTLKDYRQAHKDIREALVDEMEQFLLNHPNSAWAPSLRCNLGLYYRKTGRQTLALQHWELEKGVSPEAVDFSFTKFCTKVKCRRMPRQPRVEFPGAIYHLMNRGDRREDIFLNDVDRHDFLKTLAEACQKTGWQVHAYCLMFISWPRRPSRTWSKACAGS